MDNLQEAYLSVYEATAMAKHGYDEAPIRQKIAKSTGGGEAADRASALEKKSTFGDANKAKQRQRLARVQRGDFRNTTSSNPGLHVGQHKSDDPEVKAKQAARGAQRGALTRAEKQQLNREEFDLFDYLLEYLVAEGYADTNNAAIAIMANMSEEWKQSIVDEAYKDFPTTKVTKKAGDLMGSSAGKDDEKSKKKEKRGIKMMDTMMQHSPDN